MNPQDGRSTRTLTWLLAVTTGFEGIRAGAGTFRMLIDLPARTQVGAVAFADFSRATDLSTAGYIFYALYGIGGVVLTCGTWIVARRVRAALAIRRLSAFASWCSLLILAMTARAARREAARRATGWLARRVTPEGTAAFAAHHEPNNERVDERSRR